MLRSTLVPTVVAGVLAVVGWAIAAGGKGAVGAALGALVVVLFFGITVSVVSRAKSAAAMMNAALLTYLVMIFVLLGLIALLKGATTFDTRAFGLTVVACTLVWTAFAVRAFARLRILYADPGEAGKH